MLKEGMKNKKVVRVDEETHELIGNVGRANESLGEVVKRVFLEYVQMKKVKAS